MYLIEHVQASDRVAPPAKKNEEGKRTRKHKIGPWRYLRYHQVD
jgi:hypothetical protein